MASLSNRLLLSAMAALACSIVAYSNPAAAVQHCPENAADTATVADGPYLFQVQDGWIARRGCAGDAGERRLRTADSIRVAAVGDIPAFRVRLRNLPDRPGPAARPITSRVPILVMADSHGEYEIVVELLRRQGVIGPDLRWTFGRGQLVVLGDMLDRGPNQIELLWLLHALEGQAAAAGGAAHVLLGNHEAMVMRGDLRYLNPRYPRTAQALGARSYAELLGPDTYLGRWLRSRPAVLKLGDMLFLHGGVSPELVRSGLTIGEINQAVRRTLDVPAAERASLDETAKLVSGPAGPLWYRGYFPEHADFTSATGAGIDASLRHFAVGRIFVGHTIVPTVSMLHDGRVVAVQVYPRRDETTGAAVMEAAMRLNGIWHRARADGTQEPLEQRSSTRTGREASSRWLH